MAKPLNNPIATKTVNGARIQNLSCTFGADLFCTQDEIYKSTPSVSGIYSIIKSNTAGKSYYLVSMATHVNYNRYGKAAMVYNSANNIQQILQGVDDTVYFDFTDYDELSDAEYTYTNISEFPATLIDVERGNASVATNIPVFADATTARQYLYEENPETSLLLLSRAMNYQAEEYMPETTKTWTYSAIHSNVDLLRGTITPESEIGWRTLKIQSNTRPILYLNENNFEAGIIVPDVLASVYVAGPESVIDNIPPSSWTEGELAYNGPFYVPLDVHVQMLDSTPSDGSYVYPTFFRTDFEIQASREAAEEALATGDHSKAFPGSSVRTPVVKIGDEEKETEFGGGGFMSPFFTILSGSKTDIHRLADFLFTDDQSLWEDIKKGLEMYGSNPIDYIIGLKVFPFDVSRVVNESPRYDIWFGSYQKHFETPFNEVINMAHKYIDAGSFYMYPIQYSYLDFEPYTTLSAYFPYHGWEQLDIKKYYQKNVNVRYYVDILTGQALIVTLCDGVLTDQFGPFEIGTELPLTGANYAQWAQGQVRLLTQSASSIIGGISGGVTSGNVAGFAASSLTSLIPASQALHEARQQGGPKNTMITKGNYGSNLGNYLPGYVIFRFDINEMLEPDLLTSLAGRPSNSSGVIRNFSGFVSGKVVKMDTSGMTDSEANRIKQLIMNGIYV